MTSWRSAVQVSYIPFNQQFSYYFVLYHQYKELLPLRNLASLLLAVAVRELFPDAKLIGKQKDHFGFSYEFFFPYPLCDSLLFDLERKMHELRKENLSVKVMEMVPMSAQEYLRSLANHYHVDDIAFEEPLTTLVQIGKLVDVCPEAILDNFSSLAFFQLVSVEQHADKRIKIRGCVAFEKEDLKNAVKAYKSYEKLSPLSRKRYLLAYPKEEMVVWLPQGRKLLSLLREMGEKELEKEGVFLVESNKKNQDFIWEIFFKNYQDKYESRNILGIGEWKEDFSDTFSLFPFFPKHQLFERIFCPKNSFEEYFSSSLDRMMKLAKGWGFAFSMVLSGSGKHYQVMENLLKEKRIVFESEKNDQEGMNLQFYFEDHFGRFALGPYIKLRDEESFEGKVKGERDKKKSNFDTSSKGKKESDFTVRGKRGFESKRVNEKCLLFDSSLCEKEQFMYSMKMNYLSVERSLMGPIEDLAVMMIERKGGDLPFNLCPEQVRIIPEEGCGSRAEEILRRCLFCGLRAKIDERLLSTNEKRREGQEDKIPFLLLVKAINEKILVREFPSKKIEEMTVEAFLVKGETKKIEIDFED